MGVPAWLLGPAIAVEVGGVACLVAAVSGWRTVPWRVRDLTVEPEPSGRAVVGVVAEVEPATEDEVPADDRDTDDRKSATRERRVRRSKRSTGAPEPARARTRRPRRSTGTMNAATGPTAADPTTTGPANAATGPTAADPTTTGPARAAGAADPAAPTDPEPRVDPDPSTGHAATPNPTDHPDADAAGPDPDESGVTP